MTAAGRWVMKRVNERQGVGTYRSEEKTNAQLEKPEPYGTNYFYLREAEGRMGRRVGGNATQTAGG